LTVGGGQSEIEKLTTVRKMFAGIVTTYAQSVINGVRDWWSYETPPTPRRMLNHAVNRLFDIPDVGDNFDVYVLDCLVESISTAIGEISGRNQKVTLTVDRNDDDNTEYFYNYDITVFTGYITSLRFELRAMRRDYADNDVAKYDKRKLKLEWSSDKPQWFGTLTKELDDEAEIVPIKGDQ
jgi:hypothetical protein